MGLLCLFELLSFIVEVIGAVTLQFFMGFWFLFLFLLRFFLLLHTFLFSLRFVCLAGLFRVLFRIGICRSWVLAFHFLLLFSFLFLFPLFINILASGFLLGGGFCWHDSYLTFCVTLARGLSAGSIVTITIILTWIILFILPFKYATHCIILHFCWIFYTFLAMLLLIHLFFLIVHLLFDMCKLL